METEAPEARLERVVRLLSRQGPVNEFYVAPEVEAAARDGDARAALLAASIAGAGFGRARDWAAALDWLAIAAERGEAAARSQLKLLSGKGSPKTGAPWPHASTWRLGRRRDPRGLCSTVRASVSRTDSSTRGSALG
jgi:TPR repeat protein